MIENKQELGHIYTVELRFYGDQLIPSDLSNILNLHPSSSFDSSQAKTNKRRRISYWAYNGCGENGFQNEWGCLEEGLIFLLKILYFKKIDIINLSRKFEGCWWCANFQSSFNGGPRLSSKLLAELSGYNIPLMIENYFSDSVE